MTAAGAENVDPGGGRHRGLQRAPEMRGVEFNFLADNRHNDTCGTTCLQAHFAICDINVKI